jgi:hypothetical protein
MYAVIFVYNTQRKLNIKIILKSYILKKKDGFYLFRGSGVSQAWRAAEEEPREKQKKRKGNKYDQNAQMFVFPD